MPHIYSTNLPRVAAAFMKELNVPVTATSVKSAVQSHPDYPSFYSLSHTLTKYQVENLAIKATPADLNEFATPFIAYYETKQNGKDFVLVTALTADSVSYIYQKRKAVTVDRAVFDKKFKQVVLLAERSPESGEKDYILLLKKEKQQQQKNALRYAAAIACFIIIAAQFFYAAQYSLAAAIPIFITKMAGVTTSILLLLYETDRTNAFVKSICTAGAKVNCDAVLNSRAAKIFGISWAEAGFFYFAASFLFLVFPGTAFIQKLPWLSVAAAAVAPYIVFSIYYQYKVVKQWCPLCIAVQVILGAELVWAITQYNTIQGLGFSLPAAGLGIVLTALVIIIWYAVKPALVAVKHEEQYRYAYKRMLNDPEYFNSLLQQQAAAPDGWQQTGINIGNPQAPNTIIKVCNPYCGPCAGAHPKLEELIHHNKDYNIKIIFTATNKEGDKAAVVVRHLLAIQQQGNLQRTTQAVDDWYAAPKKDYDAFAAKYPMNGELQQQNDHIDAMNAWCNEAEIAFTPTIFINGKRLPENYNIDELKNIL